MPKQSIVLGQAEPNYIQNFVRNDTLFNIGPSTISIYARISSDLTIAVQFLASDYIKALPNFFNSLDVPFVTVVEVAPLRYDLDE